MAATAAEIAGKRGADVGISRMGIAVQQRFCGHDHSVGAITALHCLLGDESSLQRMRRGIAADAFERHDFLSGSSADRSSTGTNGRSIHDHGACAALCKAAAELCPF